jgi:2-oxoglutarate dehydrogenase E2 component (dihydrolipoamide succinyltransferase)
LHIDAAKTVSLPFLAESITDGTIGQFLRKEGEWVNQDGVVASIETSKLTVEIKSPNDGLITKLYAKVGDRIEVGRPLFDVDPDAPKHAAS